MLDMGDHGGIGFLEGAGADGVEIRQLEATPTLAQQRPWLSPRPAIDQRSATGGEKSSEFLFNDTRDHSRRLGHFASSV